ncbi:MAG: PCRF domain-containing protein [Candidatus Vogelbacteria bacterium]|nr:PCRF domain-containing protein [Candidatus Vogelbacteria bacterium]
MSQEKLDLTQKIEAYELAMQEPDFWTDKDQAQIVIKEYQDLKDKLAGVGKYDKGDAVMTIFSGAGGDDAEDFSRMLVEMYQAFAKSRGFGFILIHENKNDHGGYRNITMQIEGKNVYGILKHESGVHRLVRVSPFNSKSQRHTSFSLVEVIPKFESTKEIDIPEQDLKVEFARSSGPGGQNVNKRETSVRLTHVPTGLTVHCESERSQQANRDQALTILEGKLYKRMEEERVAQEQNMYISKTTEIEWGNQIRSYVLHPYKMVKDHRTEVETSDVEGVFDGEIDLFLDAAKNL